VSIVINGFDVLVNWCDRTTSESLYARDIDKELRELIEEFSDKHFILMGDLITLI